MFRGHERLNLGPELGVVPDQLTRQTTIRFGNPLDDVVVVGSVRRRCHEFEPVAAHLVPKRPGHRASPFHESANRCLLLRTEAQAPGHSIAPGVMRPDTRLCRDHVVFGDCLPVTAGLYGSTGNLVVGPGGRGKRERKRHRQGCEQAVSSAIFHRRITLSWCPPGASSSVSTLGAGSGNVP